MKKTIMALISVAILTLTFTIPLAMTTGCASIPGTALNKVLNKSKGVAFIITAELIKKHPEYRDGFMQASADLKFVAETDVVDVNTVMAIINRLPKLQEGDAAIYVSGLLIVFTDELSALAVKNPEEVRQAAKGLYQGIDLGLGFVVPKALKAPSK